MWRKENPCTLLVGKEICAITMENNMEVPRKIKNKITIQSSNSTPGCCAMLSRSVVPTLCDPMDYSPPGSSVHWDLQKYWSGLPCPSPGESSQPRDRTRVSRIAGRFFTV